jgi:hypothetical protein
MWWDGSTGQLIATTPTPVSTAIVLSQSANNDTYKKEEQKM